MTRNPKDVSQPELVRKEFGPATDIRTILQRHGGLPPQRQPVFSETDYNTDLTIALQNLKRAHTAFEALPKQYHDKFKTADDLWNAFKNGQPLDIDATEVNNDSPQTREQEDGRPQRRRGDHEPERSGLRTETPAPNQPDRRTPGEDPRGQPRRARSD